VKEMASLAGLAKDFSAESIVSATLPGNNYSDKVLGACWKADEEIAPRLVEALLAGESIETWSDAPSSYSYDRSSNSANTTGSTAAAEPASGAVIPEYIDIPVLEDDEDEAGHEQGGEGAGLPPEDSATPAGTDAPGTDDAAAPTHENADPAPADDNSDSGPEVPDDWPGGLPAPLE
ncbi:MAG: hypothetical protein Q4B48_06865, partial [Syntrophomonadaceae bacterium]|nr:hypothetical protein [Syntrophomonadaceae bacterium]